MNEKIEPLFFKIRKHYYHQHEERRSKQRKKIEKNFLFEEDP